LPPEQDPNTTPLVARPALSWPQRAALAVSGAAILGVAAALLFAADTPGPTTTTTTPVTTAVTTKPSTTTAVTTPTQTTVTTQPGHPARASDSLVVLLVGFGLVLLISGISGRVTKISLPGGAGLDFGTAEQKARATAKIELAKQQLPEDPVSLEMVTQGAVAQLRQQYWGTPPTPPDDAIAQAVEQAAKQLAPPPVD